MLTVHLIKDYLKFLDVSNDIDTCQEIYEFGNEIGATDYKDAVWEFLDAFEGIAHTRDPEYWGNDRDGY